MKRTRLEKELIEAGKELRLINEGKIIPQAGDEFIAELKAKHGGKQLAASRSEFTTTNS